MKAPDASRARGGRLIVGPEAVLAYLFRNSHQIAMSNNPATVLYHPAAEPKAKNARDQFAFWKGLNGGCRPPLESVWTHLRSFRAT